MYIIHVGMSTVSITNANEMYVSIVTHKKEI